MSTETDLQPVTKICGRCSLDLPAAAFTKNRSDKLGLNFYCRSCNLKMNKALSMSRVPATEGQCRDCLLTKGASDFYINRSRASGLGDRCKDCQANHRGQRRRPIIADGKKRCGRCLELKEVGDFYKSRTTRLGISHYCRACARQYKIDRYGPNHAADRMRSKKYGLSASEFAAMVARQGGHCAICGGDPTRKGLVVDHNHETGKVRALLCGKCNTAIGMLHDDPLILRRAASYIEEHQK